MESHVTSLQISQRLKELMWKDIQGYEGLYQVSDTGQVRSFKRSGSSGRILRAYKIRGYYRVWLSKKNMIRQYPVHRLVAKAFIPNPDVLPQVNHKDGNKLNNQVTNLEWCDNQHNLRHAWNTLGKTSIGSLNGKAKLTERNVVMIRGFKKAHPNVSARVLAQEYGVNRQTILDIWNRKRWAHI